MSVRGNLRGENKRFLCLRPVTKDSERPTKVNLQYFPCVGARNQGTLCESNYCFSLTILFFVIFFCRRIGLHLSFANHALCSDCRRCMRRCASRGMRPDSLPAAHPCKSAAYQSFARMHVFLCPLITACNHCVCAYLSCACRVAQLLAFRRRRFQRPVCRRCSTDHRR